MPVLWGLFYGLVIGTNSFAIAMAERMAPSLAVLERAGPYEFAGYCLIAVGTYSLARFRFTDFLAGEIQRVDTGILDEIGREDWMALLFGILVVIAAAWREAAMILEVV